MTNYVSVKITKDSKSECQINNDFHNSHNLKVNDNLNYLINDYSVKLFIRDSNIINTDYIIYSINNAIEKVKYIHKNERKVETGHKCRSLKSNTQLMWSGIITFNNDTNSLSQSHIDNLNQIDLNNNALNFFNEFIIDNNLDKKSSYLVRHNDEILTHYHFKFIAYDLKNKELFSNRVKKCFLSSLQEKVSKHFKSSGFNRKVKNKKRTLKKLDKENKTLYDYISMNIVEKSLAMYIYHKKINNNKTPSTIVSTIESLQNELALLQQERYELFKSFDLNILCINDINKDINITSILNNTSIYKSNVNNINEYILMLENKFR